MGGDAPPAPVLAILLAAGRSSRMGRAKALLPWGGRPLVARQAEALRDGGVAEVVVVTGHQGQQVAEAVAGLPVRTVHNPGFAQGRTTSIKAGLEAVDAGTAAVLVLSVDQPRPAWLIARVLAAHAAAQALVTIPTYQGRGGHPAVFSAALLPELRAITEEEQGLRAVVRRHADAVHRVEVGTPLAVLDLNTPEDYQRALAQHAGLFDAPPP